MDIKPSKPNKASSPLKLPEQPNKRPEKKKPPPDPKHNTLIKTLKRNEEVAEPRKNYVEDDEDENWDDFSTPTPSKLNLNKLKLTEPPKAGPLLNLTRQKSASAPPPRDAKDKEKTNGLNKWADEKDDDWGELGTKFQAGLPVSGSWNKNTGPMKRPGMPGTSVKDVFEEIEEDLDIFDEVEELDVLQKDVWSKMTEDAVKLM
jgi:hypothetical protein